MERYEIAIIGTGPAGLEAAITAKVRNKKVLLLGNDNLSIKVEKAHTIDNYLGLPGVSGEKMQKKFKEHLEKMQIEITKDRVNTIYAMGEYFAIQGHENMYEAQTVILACGIFSEKILPGEMENLGRGVSYCATCDAALYRGKKAIVVSFSQKEEEEANFLSEIADEVVYVKMYECEKSLNKQIKVVSDVKLLGIEKDENGVILNTNKENIKADGIFILRESVATSQLVPGLNLKDSHVIVDRNLCTNIEGLFACGDITGTPYQYIKAAGEGNVAALSAVNYLAKKK